MRGLVLSQATHWPVSVLEMLKALIASVAVGVAVHLQHLDNRGRIHSFQCACNIPHLRCALAALLLLVEVNTIGMAHFASGEKFVFALRDFFFHCLCLESATSFARMLWH